MRKKSHEEFILDIHNLVNSEYTVLEEYVNMRTKILMKHNTCNYIWKVKPLHFINSNSRCPNCNKYKIKSETFYKSEISKLHNNEYRIISEYVNSKTKVKIQHKPCEYIWDIVPTLFLSSKRKCPKCFGCIRNRDLAYFKKELIELVKNEYEVLGSYTDTQTKIEIKHNNCNKTYFVSPAQFLSGDRCPYCKSSKGESKIANFLESKKLKFKREYRFIDCKNKRQLPFDFAVFDNNDNIAFIIEYDGSQHFEPKFGMEAFELTVHNDLIKNNYCKSNNINLIRIPYWDFDRIEEILNSKLNKIYI